MAQYYENNQNPGKAGEYYKICGNYHKSLKLFLSCGEKELEQAIEVVGKARNDMLTHTLIDYLMGETDGVPKDPNYIFRLYMVCRLCYLLHFLNFFYCIGAWKLPTSC